MRDKKRFFIIILFTLGVKTSVFAHLWSHPFSWKHIDATMSLEKGIVVSICSLSEFFKKNQKREVPHTSQAQYVELDNGVSAIFKPVSQMHMPDAEAELVAYRLSLYWDNLFVPPTVIRSINGVIGSLQMYVSSCEGTDSELYGMISKEQRESYELFCFIFGQWDWCADNRLFYKDEDGKLYIIAIDNGAISFRQQVRYGESPFVGLCYHDAFLSPESDWQTLFPFEKAESITEEMITYLEQLEIPAVSALKKQLSKNVYDRDKVIIFQNRLWRQFSFSSPILFSQITNEMYQLLLQLDYPFLEQLFESTSDYFNKSFLNQILDRKNYVLQWIDTDLI